MKKKTIKPILLFTLLILSFPFYLLTKPTVKDLPKRHKKWLEEEVVYIITANEKEVFFKLESDKERDLFIEAFWKQRDPTPGTPENEFKKEHYLRINYANQRLGVGSPRPGWRTDRGRIYITLGEPMSRESYTTQRELRDTEIWFYNEMTKYGLPMAFNIVFYRKGMSGDFQLYSPNNDGPQAFFIKNPQIDQADYFANYQKLMEINATIAGVSLSLIPGETPLVSARPSLASDILLQSINYVPQKEIKDLYAEKFLNYKSIVEVEYSANYVDSDYLIQIIKDDSGLFFVHYLISPERFSVGQYENNYYSRFVVNGNITDLEGKFIYQFEKEYTLNLDEDRIKSLSQTPFQINDMFPLIPGNYKFSLLLKNTVSKEFSTFEQDIFIPDTITSPEIGSLLLCYSTRDMQSSQSVMRPFQINQRLLFTQPKNVFLLSETLVVYGQVFGLSQSIIETGRLEFSIIKGEEIIKSFSRSIKEYRQPINFLEEFELAEFPAAYYTLRVSLLDQTGRELAVQSKYFAVSPVAGFPRPFIQSKALPASNDALNNFRIGSQLFNKGYYKEASTEFEKALKKNPREIDFAVLLAKTYLYLKKYEDIEATLTPFLNDEDIQYEVYFYLGKSTQARGHFEKAIQYYNQAISHFGLNIYLLNSLGDCYFNLKKLPEAKAAWEKSLEMSPDQPQIQEKVASIREK